MTTVNVHEAKTHFSRLLDRAHAGEEIIVAKAGKPFAKLGPLMARKSEYPGDTPAEYRTLSMTSFPTRNSQGGTREGPSGLVRTVVVVV